MIYDVTGWHGRHSPPMKSTTPILGATNGTSNSASIGGFDGYLVGYAGPQLYSYGIAVDFWTASAYNFGAWFRTMMSTATYTGRFADSRSYLMSVRCKKDD